MNYSFPQLFRVSSKNPTNEMENTILEIIINNRTLIDIIKYRKLYDIKSNLLIEDNT